MFTTATTDEAQAATGLTAWTNGEGSSLSRTFPARGIAVNVVAALRAAGCDARASEDIPDGAAEAMARLAEIGRKRAAKKIAEDNLRRMLEEFNEADAMMQAREAGASTADIARAAGCDRVWVHKMIGATYQRPRAKA